MYKEIEELEKTLTRKPAQQVDSEMINVEGQLPTPQNKQLIDYGPDNRASSEGLNLYDGASSVTGAVAPDYSGYDDILKGLEGKKPRDTSLIDLIGMGASLAIGGSVGQFGTAAKEAGDYGMKRAAANEKKEDSIEAMIAKLKLDRASKMAAGKKGTKTGSAGDWRGKTYVNPQDGKTYWMRFADQTGQPVPTKDDRAIQSPQVRLENMPNADGSQRVVPVQGNVMGGKNQGVKPVANQLKPDAEGNLQGINPYTNQASEVQGKTGDFNKTSLGLSKSDDTRYAKLEDDFTKNSKAFSQSNQQAKSGLTALASMDNASAIMALKEALRAAEGGKVSDADFSIMKTGLGPSYEARLDAWLGKSLDGQTLSDNERKELRNMLVHIENSSSRGQEQNIRTYNGLANKFLDGYSPEVKNQLQFKNNWRGYDAETQKSEAAKNIQKRNQMEYRNPVVRKFQGKLYEGYIDENGKFIVTDEARQ